MAKKKGLIIGIAAVIALAAVLCVWLLPKGEKVQTASDQPLYTLPDEGARDGDVLRLEGESWFPEEKNWVYHFVYAYPQVAGDSYAALTVNDTYRMALDEMLQLVLPMFANSPDMRFDGKNEVTHDFEVKCNNGRFLSILQKKGQSRGENGMFYSLESLTFDMNGEYMGESLTLRGVVSVGDSTDQIAAAVLPEIYEQFCLLQQQGVCKKGVDEETFAIEFSPAIHFYADENGHAVFYLPPSLMEIPGFDTPTFTYSPAELEALLNE